MGIEHMADGSVLRSKLEELHALSFGWAMNCCAHNRQEAEDVLQTAYLKVLQGKAVHDGRSSFKTWLFAVIRLSAAEERRRNWFRHTRLEEYRKSYEAGEQGSATGTMAGEMDSTGRFRAALARLPRRQGEVLHLVFYQELTLREAANVMVVSIGSARRHYERGKDGLRRVLTNMESGS